MVTRLVGSFRDCARFSSQPARSSAQSAAGPARQLMESADDELTHVLKGSQDRDIGGAAPGRYPSTAPSPITQRRRFLRGLPETVERVVERQTVNLWALRALRANGRAISAG